MVVARDYYVHGRKIDYPLKMFLWFFLDEITLDLHLAEEWGGGGETHFAKISTVFSCETSF